MEILLNQLLSGEVLNLGQSFLLYSVGPPSENHYGSIVTLQDMAIL